MVDFGSGRDTLLCAHSTAPHHPSFKHPRTCTISVCLIRHFKIVSSRQFDSSPSLVVCDMVYVSSRPRLAQPSRGWRYKIDRPFTVPSAAIPNYGSLSRNYLTSYRATPMAGRPFTSAQMLNEEHDPWPQLAADISKERQRMFEIGFLHTPSARAPSSVTYVPPPTRADAKRWQDPSWARISDLFRRQRWCWDAFCRVRTAPAPSWYFLYRPEAEILLDISRPSSSVGSSAQLSDVPLLYVNHFSHDRDAILMELGEHGVRELLEELEKLEKKHSDSRETTFHVPLQMAMLGTLVQVAWKVAAARQSPLMTCLTVLQWVKNMIPLEPSSPSAFPDDP